MRAKDEKRAFTPEALAIAAGFIEAPEYLLECGIAWAEEEGRPLSEENVEHLRRTIPPQQFWDQKSDGIAAVVRQMSMWRRVRFAHALWRFRKSSRRAVS